MRAARLLVLAFLLVALAAVIALLPEAKGATWVTAPSPGKWICDPTTIRAPVLTMGPKGLEYERTEPTCEWRHKDRSTLWHLHGRTLTDSQHTVPAGTPCLRLTTIDHFTYGQTAESGMLWALCRPGVP